MRWLAPELMKWLRAVLALLALVALAAVPLRPALAAGGLACAGLAGTLTDAIAGTGHVGAGHHGHDASATVDPDPTRQAPLPSGVHGGSDCATCLLHCIGIEPPAVSGWTAAATEPSRMAAPDGGGEGLNPPPADPPPRRARLV